MSSLKPRMAIPEGNYQVAYRGFSLCPLQGKFGPMMDWLFTIEQGSYTGVILKIRTGQEPTLKTNCGGIQIGIAGELTTRDMDEFIGCLYTLDVFVKTGGQYNDFDHFSLKPVGARDKDGVPTMENPNEAIAKLFDKEKNGVAKKKIAEDDMEIMADSDFTKEMK